MSLGLPPRRSLSIMTAVLLVVLAGGLVWVAYREHPKPGAGAGTGDTDSSARNSQALDFMGDREGSRVRRVTAAQAKARVNSLMALKSDEVGVIRLPEGKVEQHFKAVEPVDGKGRGRGIPFLALGSGFPNHGRDALESILVDGGKLNVDIRRDEEGLLVNGEQFRMKVVVGMATDTSKLLKLDIYGNDGRTILVTNANVPKGSVLLVRSPDPSPEGFLIVIGNDDEAKAE